MSPESYRGLSWMFQMQVVWVHLQSYGKCWYPSWDGGPFIINPIYTLYHVGIYWVYISPFKGLQQGVKQLWGPPSQGAPTIFPMIYKFGNAMVIWYIIHACTCTFIHMVSDPLDSYKILTICMPGTCLS